MVNANNTTLGFRRYQLIFAAATCLLLVSGCGPLVGVSADSAGQATDSAAQSTLDSAAAGQGTSPAASNSTGQTTTGTQTPGEEQKPMTDAGERELMTVGGGCFWCTESVFLELKGVESVVSGYSGGLVPNPTYEQVCTGLTGHAEVIQVKFDPSQINYEDLLHVFFATHDPTTLNRQGPDRGTQYRSVIFFHSDQQRQTAERVKSELDASGEYQQPVVTEITEFTKFYPAEDYHQNFFANNPDSQYCQISIPPKLQKLRAKFADKLKPRE